MSIFSRHLIKVSSMRLDFLRQMFGALLAKISPTANVDVTPDSTPPAMPPGGVPPGIPPQS